MSLQIRDDGLDVVPRPSGDGRAQIAVREPIEPRGKHPVEGVHQDLHRVLHVVVESSLLIRGRIPHARLVQVTLCHQVAKQEGHQPCSMLVAPEPHARRCGVKLVLLGRLLWVRGINPRGVADVVANHDAGVHALEVQHGNPRVQTCFHVMDVTSRDLTFLRLGAAGHRYGNTGSVRTPDHQGIDELACASVAGGLEGDLGHRGYGFLSAHDLQGVQDVQRQGCVSTAILEHHVGACRPFLVHA